MAIKDVYIKARRDAQWESEALSKRPLRGPQAEVIHKVEKHILCKSGGVMPIRFPRQAGKNEISAVLHRRHFVRRCTAPYLSTWIRTAPTHRPQIVNSKKRLQEILQVDNKWRIKHPLLYNQKLGRSEGYIWRVGNAVVKFLSSGKQSNVVGDTASECLDMDEAHKIDRNKFDEDFLPFTANTDSGTILWGVASNGLDTMASYREHNIEIGRPDLNLDYPCEIWMDINPKYRNHVEGRVAKLGWNHPIIKTQYRLIEVAAEGKFLTGPQQRALLSGDHERHLTPRDDCHYEMLIDVAAGNEDFNPENIMEGNEDTATDSTIVWIYEVSPVLCGNGVFPIIRIRNLIWLTGVALEKSQEEIDQLIEYWRPEKVTIDGVGVGRQIAESMALKYSAAVFHDDQWVGGTVLVYMANETSVSQDCFDLQARLNFKSVSMFANDDSPEWAEFERQVGWTLYTSKQGKMKLVKPDSTKHIDMVKGLTYFNRNNPSSVMHALYAVESEES